MRKMDLLRLCSLAALAAALEVGLGAGTALAQVKPPSDDTTVADIIVTAQRRSENLQAVPVAATAFGAEALEKSGAVNILDVAAQTPGVTMTEYNIGEPQVYVRGVGSQSDSASSEPSVTVSVDEVPISRGGATGAAFLDTQRVEVLRGPQGTLYGRNASAGAINIYTNRPTFDFGGRVEASAGRFGTYGAKGVVNAPLSDAVALRVAAQYSDSDGYARTTPSNARLQGGERYAARVQLLARRGDWDVLASLDHSFDDLAGDARHTLVTPLAPAPLAAIVNNAQAGRDVWTTYGRPDAYQKRANTGGFLRLEHTGEAFNFVSLTAYRDNEYSFLADLSGLPDATFPFQPDDYVDEDSHQFSQELRLTSSDAARIKWVGGLFYFRESIDRVERIVTDSRAPLPAALSGDVSMGQDAAAESYAAFGQATIPFARIWELTLGARLTHDKRDVFQSLINNRPSDTNLAFPVFPGSLYAVPAKADFTKPTWRINLAVEPSPGKHFYASYDRGYKSGSFTSQAQNAAQATTLVRPEQLDNFNLGAKTQWLSNRLRLNADAFYLDYKDLQVFEFGSSLNFVVSNADAKVKGVELQALAALSHNVTLGANYAYLDTEFTSNPAYGGATLPYKGNVLPRAPQQQYSVYVETNHQVLDGELTARLAYDWRDDFYYNPSNDVASKQKAYGVVGGYLAFETADQWKIALTGENLGNTRYSVHNISFQNMGFRLYAPPRTWTLTLSKAF